jgi:transcriptional regulator with XRE-family HTH domain
LGFFGLPVSHWRPDLSSLFPEFYDRALEQLVLARKAARVTQAALAETLGRPQSFVAKYESGESRLDVAEFVGIARAIGADPFKMLKTAGRNSG